MEAKRTSDIFIRCLLSKCLIDCLIGRAYLACCAVHSIIAHCPPSMCNAHHQELTKSFRFLIFPLRYPAQKSPNVQDQFQHFVINQISYPRKGMLPPWTLGIAVGVTAAVGYCVYFDHKRRSDPNFRQKVRERRARAAQAANRASGMPDASDPAAVQRYFMTELQVRNIWKRTLVLILLQPVLGRWID